MNNLYDFLMARELGNIKDAPNKQRIGQAPLNLRSAMKYANGGGIGYPPSQIAGLTPLDSRPPEPPPLKPLPPGLTLPEPNFPKRERPEKERLLPLPEPRYPDRVDPPRPEKPQPDRPDVRPVMPENYPQDYAGPRTTGSTQTQQVGPRTSYRQEADGTMTEIGYDGQPVSNYTAQQAAMNLATKGGNPAEIMALLQQMYGLNNSDASIPNPEKSLSPYLPTYKPPPIPEKSLSPYLPTYTPPKVSEESLSPNIPSYTPASSDARYAFSNDLLSLLNDKNSPKLSGGVGSGMPGPGTDQSLDYLIHYLATKLK